MLGFFTKNNKEERSWLQVGELEVGMEIAVPRGKVFSKYFDPSTSSGQVNLDCPNDEVLAEGEGDVMWDEIVSIEKVGEERVYDIEVEGTHNFVAGQKMGETAFGGLFAHNTYITGGNLGVGTSSPYANISVGGSAVGTTLLSLDALSGQTAPILDVKLASTTKFSVGATGATTTNFAITSLGGGGGDLKVAADGSIYEGTDANDGGGANFAWDVNAWGNSTTTTIGLLNGFLSTASSTQIGDFRVLSGNLGVGTTTPWAQLSVNPNGATGPSFVIGSSTKTDFIVTNGGNVGVGTTGTTSALFAIQGKAATYQDLFKISSSTGASVLEVSWYGGLTQNISSTTAVNIQDGSGNSIFAVDTTQSSTNAGIDITAGGSQTGNLLNFYSSAGSFLSGFTASGALLFDVSSTTAIQVLNGLATQVFAVDTVNSWLQIATSTSPTFTTDGQFTIGNADATASGGRIWIRSGATTFRFQSDANTADYSEFFFQYEDSEVGDVISLADRGYIDSVKGNSTTTPPANTGIVRKSNVAYDKILGVVTDRGTSFNNPEDTRQKSDEFANVGLLGHIITKVTNENGPIEAGDFLTSSETREGFAMKATRSGYILGQALEDFTGEGIGDTGVVTVFVSPEYRVIENTFVLGEEDNQLITHIENSLSISATSSNAIFMINQKGSGDLLQLQQNGIDRLLVKNDGSIKVFSNMASTADNSIFAIENTGGEIFSIKSNGDANIYGNLKIAGNIYASKDTAGSAVITMGNNSTKVVFEKPYAGAPKVIATVLGLPEGPYGVVDKTEEGFTILMNGVAQKDIKFDWVAIYQPENVNSVSGLMSIIPGNYDDGFGEIVIVPDASTSTSTSTSTATSTEPVTGEVAGTSTTTPPVIDDTVDETATTTPDVLVEEELILETEVETTPEPEPEPSDTSTTTPTI